MDRTEIQTILPHRPPMLLVDEAHIEGDTAVGRYTVRGDEFFLQGHFPGNPVVPGVILCEMMGQSSAVLIADKMAGATPFFSGMDKVRFRRIVRPGDTIVFTTTLTANKGAFYFMTGTGTVNDELCVSAELSFALVR